ncbi:MAG: stage II sporulation protein R, partial [Bacillota bacterium]
VELGTAEGKNWWCVLFPPLCLVDAGVQDIPDSDKLVFESDIARLIKEWQDSNTAMNNAE